MTDSNKRQRLDEAVEHCRSAGANNANHSKMPAELWSGVLGFLFFGDVLNVIAVNRFFNRDVPQQVKLLLIQKAGSMKVSTTTVNKFSGVTDVFVYSLIKEISPGGSYSVWTAVGDNVRCDNDTRYFDTSTIENVLPFLLHFSKLNRCFIGGLCTCEDEDHASWTAAGDNVRCDNSFCPGERYTTANSDAKFAVFVESICRAYNSGELSQNVKFVGIVPEQWGQMRGEQCAWTRTTPLVEISSHRDDVDCQMCDLLCASFPPAQVMDFSNSQIPCIYPLNRLKIAYCRDPKAVKARSMESLLNVLKQAGGMPVLHPPDFTEHGFATNYSVEQYTKMRWLTSNGADVKDPRIRTLLLEEHYDEETGDGDAPLGWDYILHKKRIMLLSVYNEMKEIGFDFLRSDFVLIDYSDIRTVPHYNRPPAYQSEDNAEDED